MPCLLGLLVDGRFIKAFIVDDGGGSGGVEGKAGRGGRAVGIRSAGGYGRDLQGIDLVGVQCAGIGRQGGGFDCPGIQQVAAGIQQRYLVFRHVALGLPGHGQDVAGDVADVALCLFHGIEGDDRLGDAGGLLDIRLQRGFVGQRLFRLRYILFNRFHGFGLVRREFDGFHGFGFVRREFDGISGDRFVFRCLGQILGDGIVIFRFARRFDGRFLRGQFHFGLGLLNLQRFLYIRPGFDFNGRIKGGHEFERLLGKLDLLLNFNGLGFVDRLRRGIGLWLGRGLRRGIGLGQLHLGQGELDRIGAGGLHVAVLRYRGDGDGVDFTGTHGAGADAGNVLGRFLLRDDLAALILDAHFIGAHIALGIPIEGDVTGQEVIHAAFRAANRADDDLGQADGFDLHFIVFIRRLDPREVDLGLGDVLAVAVLGVGPDAKRVDLVEVQRGQGDAGAGHQRILVDVYVALGVIHADAVVVHAALHIPAEDDIAVRGAFLGDVVNAFVLEVIFLDVDVRFADDGGLHVFGSIFLEQQPLGVYGGDAGGLQADLLLEEGHGFLGLPAEVAVHGTVVVVQRFQAALQAGDALVVIAAAQHDVAGGFRGVVGEQQALHGLAGVAGVLQSRRALEYAHRRAGFGSVGAAGAVFQIVEIPQAVVQLAHAIAGVAGIQVDVAGALAGAVGIEALQRIPGGGIGFRQAVFILEQLYGLQCAGTEYAVRRVGQVAQLPQALLHLPHAHPAVAPGQLVIGIVGAQPAGEYDSLQLGVGDAGHGALQVKLQQLYGGLGAGAEYAVHIVVVIAQILQRLLDGADGVAAAAPGQCGVLGRGLQLVRRGLLAGKLQGVDQPQHGGGHFGLRFEFDEREGGLRGLFHQLRIDVQLAAHGLYVQPVHIVFLGHLVGRQVGIALEYAQRALDGVHPAYGVVGGQHEQRLAAGGQLVLHLHAGGQHDLRGLCRGIVGLQPQGAACAGQVVDGIVQPGKGGHIAVDQAGAVIEKALQVQLGVVGQVDLVALAERAASGHAAAVDLKAVGILGIQHRGGTIHQLEDRTLRGHVKPVDGLRGRVDDLVRQAVQVGADQLLAIGAGHVIGRVLVSQARGHDVRGNQGFLQTLQVNRVQVLGVQEVVGAQIEHAVGVHAHHAVCRLGVDGFRLAGQVQVPFAVCVGGKGVAAGDGAALRHRKGDGEQAQREQQYEKCCSFHGPVLLMMILLGRN